MKEPQPQADLGVLSALGFGPNAALMSEPKLFIDPHFLGCLMAELEEELSPEGAQTALFQIGLMHGLRDAYRVIGREFLQEGAAPASRATPLALRFGARIGQRPLGAIEIPGSWPECYEAQARLAELGPCQHPSCALSAGYTSGWLSGTLDADILVLESSCAAAGDEGCQFFARELEAWRDASEPRALSLMRAVPFDIFRDITSHDVDPDTPASEAGDFDPEAAVVHIWGPVMVLPLTTTDDALRTVEMLSRDPGSCSVRVVVFDLRNAIVDEGFAAATIEQIVESIESWGAEIIITGVSPLSEHVIAELESAHLLVRKDLPDAIAAGFQVAEAQRHLL